MTDDLASLQDRYAPRSTCFGCGPANARGLRIKSFARDGEVVAQWRPEAHHEAFPGVLCGGIIGTLLDCHCNWAAAVHLMRRAADDHVPATVTAEYAIHMRRPTPTGEVLTLRAHVVESDARRAVVEGTLEAAETVCATCRGVFIAVREGHPAYHRWD